MSIFRTSSRSQRTRRAEQQQIHPLVLSLPRHPICPLMDFRLLLGNSSVCQWYALFWGGCHNPYHYWWDMLESSGLFPTFRRYLRTTCATHTFLTTSVADVACWKGSFRLLVWPPDKWFPATTYTSIAIVYGRRTG